jgi:hypothetical protein
MLISSDSENTTEGRASHDSASSSGCYEQPSDLYVSTASEGHDPAHAIEISPSISLLHSSDRISVPDMGLIA